MYRAGWEAAVPLGVLAAADVAAVALSGGDSSDMVSMIGILFSIAVLQVGAIVVFRILKRNADMAAGAVRRINDLEVERAARTAIMRDRAARDRKLDRDLLPLVRGLADGRLDPEDPATRQRCDVAAGVLRAMIAHDGTTTSTAALDAVAAMSEAAQANQVVPDPHIGPDFEEIPELVRERLLTILAATLAILHFGLETWLSMAGPGPELVATAQSVAELLSGPGRTARVVLLDLRLHDHVPIADNVRAIRAAGPAVVACSSADDLDMIREAIAAGAHSYVPKRRDPAEARAAIEAAAAGLPYTSRAHAAAMADDRRPGRPALSHQEREALRLCASGLTMESVARRLRIRPGTAKSYVDRVREKYDQAGRPARSKIELRDRAVEDGILPQRTVER